MPKLTVKVDPSLCIAAATCVGIAPQFFQINDEGFSEVVSAGEMRGYEYTLELSEKDAESIEEAAESCPTRAITSKSA